MRRCINAAIPYWAAAQFTWNTWKMCCEQIRMTEGGDDIDFLFYVFTGTPAQCDQWNNEVEAATDEIFARIRAEEEAEETT